MSRELRAGFQATRNLGDAVQQKQYDDAIELYKRALEVATWIPGAYYNIAMISADQGDYQTAVSNMKKYLMLVPGAPDAQAAQNQLWAWERRAESAR